MYTSSASAVVSSVYRPGGWLFSGDPEAIYLRDFRFRPHERFTYEYNFYAGWVHDIRLGKRPDVCSNTWIVHEFIEAEREHKCGKTQVSPAQEWQVSCTD
jgi:hypothetical protein